MKIISSIYKRNFKFSKLSVTIFCLLLFLSFQNVGAQLLDTDLKLAFVKDSDDLISKELHFNTLVISNNTAKPISGELAFRGPENWKIISFSSNQTTINPGDTVWVPFRVSPSIDASGGISYLINATFKTTKKFYSANSYLNIPPISKWDFNTSSSSVYISDNLPYATFKVKLTNKGNVNEVIRLDYKLGKILSYRNMFDNENTVEYVALPAFKDTIISRTVTFQTNLSSSEKVRYERNWKESSVKVVASTPNENIGSEIQIRKLNSLFVNQRAQINSPLNFDYNIYNIMSNQAPRSNLNVYGSVLFTENREIQYNAGLQNIDFTGFQDFDFDRQILYNFKYLDKKNQIQLSYNTYGGTLHSINGRGIVGSYRLDDKNKFNYAFIQNPFTHNIGANLGYAASVGKFSVQSEITHENNENGYNATSLLMGGGFSFLKNHRFSMSVMGSSAKYNVAGRDTSLFGASYRFNYGVSVKDFEFRISALSSMYNVIQNSGMQQYYVDGRYTLTDKVRFALYGNRLYYSTTKYPYNLSHLPNFNSSDYIRLTTIFNESNIIYQVGPNYIGSMRQTVNAVTGALAQFNSYQPGIWGSATFRINGYRSISPNITLSNMSMKYTSTDPAIQDYTLNNGLAYSVGVNYFDENFRVNAYYTTGSSSDMMRSIEIYEQPSVTKSIQVRPSYENYFFNKTVKIGAFVNYAYYLPSERQNITYNVKYEQKLNKGWNAYLSGFVFSNSRINDEGGRITTMDLNFIAGISKSFNIQQPRNKYYNLRAVFFSDLDGNRTKSDNEPPVSNILVQIKKDRNIASTQQSGIAEVELVSDVNGEIAIENLPKDNYRMAYQPIVNLQSYYFLNGSEQGYYNDKDRVLYVPLVESYKIKGKIILMRDPNSTEGKINLEGVRIMAVGLNGETYTVLTDNGGGYILNVPNADKYTVKINNVFGEQFSIDANEIQVQFTKNKTINLDFTFVEKRREINFNNGNQIFKFNTE